jgi:hypothetical protein
LGKVDCDLELKVCEYERNVVSRKAWLALHSVMDGVYIAMARLIVEKCVLKPHATVDPVSSWPMALAH